MKYVPVLLLACVACFGSTACVGLTHEEAQDKLIARYTEGDWFRAPSFIPVHANPAVGQYWQTTTTVGKTRFVRTRQIVKVEKDYVIVEDRTTYRTLDDSRAPDVAYHDNPVPGMVLAYKVDTQKGAKEALNHGNVIQAWIGKPGDRPRRIKNIMDPPYPAPEAASDANSPRLAYSVVSRGEPFTETLAGKIWTGKKVTSLFGSADLAAMGGAEWRADDGWFGGVIRSIDTSGALEELSALGDDGEPWLLWTDQQCRAVVNER